MPPETSPDDADGSDASAATTGRWVVVFADVADDATALLGGLAAGAAVADSRDFADGVVDLGQTAAASATVFAELGIAVVDADRAAVADLLGRAAARAPVLSVSPELVHHVLTESGPPPPADTQIATWGLQATGVLTSVRSGRGTRVAVLDTGVDLTHPDVVGRGVQARSFVPGETAQDGQGHGTHVLGTACGPAAPVLGPRYGVAPDAEVFVGKVLSDAGSGTDAAILAGINWAVLQGCDVVSMSLGADVPAVHPPYTTAGRRALDRGSLLVAAAGNNADRSAGRPGFVGPPASSPYVLAVAALDPARQVAEFSARSLPGTRGGQVDLAAPGVDVLSAWPMPVGTRTISGTSMATPHVAGIAALWVEETGLRGRELWAVLSMESDRLLAASVDVGAGLVLAPQPAV